jgi:hypothetical protein
MEWKNTQKNQLPQSGKEVLLSVNGIYYVGIYHHPDKKFLVYDSIPPVLPVSDYSIYWTELNEFPDQTQS